VVQQGGDRPVHRPARDGVVVVQDQHEVAGGGQLVDEHGEDVALDIGAGRVQASQRCGPEGGVGLLHGQEEIPPEAGHVAVRGVQ
jgi:hypothetical protein